MEKWKKHYYLGIFSILIGIFFFVLLFVVFPILNPHYKFDYISRSFSMVLPLIIGVIEIREASKYKKDKFFFPFGILTISKSNIKTFLQEKIIEGDGSQNKPFQILDYSKLPSTIMLTKIESFFQINNTELDVLKLRKCRNILISNCNIERIHLIYCTDVIIDNNVIQVFKIENSWNNVIKNNKISEKYLDKNKLSRFPVDELTYFIVFSIAIIFLGYMSIKSHFFYIFTIMFIMAIGGWSMMFVSFIVKLKYFFYPKKNPNIKSENVVIKPLNR